MQYCLRTLLIVASLCGVIAGTLFIAFVVTNQGEIIRDAYCIDWAEAAIVQHLDDNDNHFPRNWQELQSAFDKVTSKDNSFSFDEVKSRVIVNFGVDPNGSNPQYIWLKSGRDVSWGSPPPNERIHQYISKKHRHP